MLITAYNPETENYEKSFLTSAISAGVTTLNVKNNQKFALNDRIMIGEQGREKTEIVTVTGAVSAGQVLTIGATTFAHEADDPVYILRFDQVNFYRSTSESGEYTLVSGVALDVDNENLTTSYDDATGTSSSWYKVTFSHSITTQASALSDAMQGTGYDVDQVGYLLDEVLMEIGDPEEKTTSKNMIINDLNECNYDLTSRVSRPYSFLHTRTTLSTVADNETVDFPELSSGKEAMWKFDRMDYLYTDDNGDTILYPVRVISAEEFRYRFQDTDPTPDDQLQLIALDTAVGKFRLYPTPETSQAGALYLNYWKHFDTINSSGDRFETPNSRVYKLFCLYKHYERKGRDDSSFMNLANTHQTNYEREAARLVMTNHRDSGSPRGFSFNPQTFKGNRRF